MSEGCHVHLAGNVQCPAEAVYVLRWHHNSIGGLRLVYRTVCTAHLEHALLSDLETTGRSDPWVSFSLLGLADVPKAWKGPSASAKDS